jgi:hypothetical protein
MKIETVAKIFLVFSTFLTVFFWVQVLFVEASYINLFGASSWMLLMVIACFYLISKEELDG